MNNAMKLWGIPLLMAVLTIFGLLAALNGVGIWHWFSWLALGAPAAAMIWYLYKGLLKKEV